MSKQNDISAVTSSARARCTFDQPLQVDTRGHRFDALPFPRQTEPGDIGAERTMPILVTEDAGEPFNIRVKRRGAGAVEY